MYDAFDYLIQFRVSDSRGIFRVVTLQRSTREYLNEFFPRKLSLSHNREERANGKNISFRDDYEQFQARIVSTDKGCVTSFSLVACICKTSLLQFRNQMRR